MRYDHPEDRTQSYTWNEPETERSARADFLRDVGWNGQPILAINGTSPAEYLSRWPFKSVRVWRPSIDLCRARARVCVRARTPRACVYRPGIAFLHTGCPLSQGRSPILRYWRCYRQLSIDILASTLREFELMKILVQTDALHFFYSPFLTA